MPSNDIEGPITRCDAVWRCCRLSSAAVFHFLATSWMPANCFFCPPPSLLFPSPTPTSPSRFFHSFCLNEAALFVCLFRPQTKRKKSSFINYIYLFFYSCLSPSLSFALVAGMYCLGVSINDKRSDRRIRCCSCGIFSVCPELWLINKKRQQPHVEQRQLMCL